MDYEGFVGLEREAEADGEEEESRSELCRSLKKKKKTATAPHPGRGVLQDVGFQLLHEDLVVEDDDGVVVALADQDVLEGLKNQSRFSYFQGHKVELKLIAEVNR